MLGSIETGYHSTDAAENQDWKNPDFKNQIRGFSDSNWIFILFFNFQLVFAIISSFGI